VALEVYNFGNNFVTERCETGFVAIPSAGIGFFASAWLMMIFWGIVAPGFGIKTIGYPTAMLVTIGIWLVVAPFIAAAVKRSK